MQIPSPGSSRLYRKHYFTGHNNNKILKYNCFILTYMDKTVLCLNYAMWNVCRVHCFGSVNEIGFIHIVSSLA